MSGDAIECVGVVLEEQRGGLYVCEVAIGDSRRRVLARCSGRLHINHIRCVPGDDVVLEVSPYDTTRGRIVYRGRRESRT